jgi:hypothetical protein
MRSTRTMFAGLGLVAVILAGCGGVASDDPLVQASGILSAPTQQPTWFVARHTPAVAPTVGLPSVQEMRAAATAIPLPTPVPAQATAIPLPTATVVMPATAIPLPPTPMPAPVNATAIPLPPMPTAMPLELPPIDGRQGLIVIRGEPNDGHCVLPAYDAACH